jgi:hypothetical protein
VRRLLLSLLLVLTAPAGLALAQTGTVTLKINVVNPSEKEPQTVPVKVHLPKEVTPKHITQAGDLKVEFDPEAGTYYVHGEVALEAGQSITRIVQMEDIWVFSSVQLLAFVTQAKEMASKLSEPAASVAADVVQRIEQKVQDVVKRQEETDGKPAERIQAYREGLATIATIQQDLDALDRLTQGAKARAEGASGTDSGSAVETGAQALPDEAGAVGGSGSVTTTWRIIFGILAFLAVVSGVAFLTSHRVLRASLLRETEPLPLATATLPLATAERR